MEQHLPTAPNSGAIRVPSPLQLHIARVSDHDAITSTTAAIHDTNTTSLARPTPTSPLRRLWQKALEMMGCTGPDGSRQRRRENVRFAIFVVATIGQVITIVVLTALAAVRRSPVPDYPGQSELDACAILGVWNLVWLARLMLRCYVVLWIIQQKRKGRTQGLAGLPWAQPSLDAAADGAERQAGAQEARQPGVRITPFSTRKFGSLHLFLFKFDPFARFIWFFGVILSIYVHGNHCRVAARDVSATTYTILIILYAQFIVNTIFPMLRMVAARRRASSRPVIQKLSRAQVHRIPLVLYIPPPPDDTPSNLVTPIPRSASASYPPDSPLTPPSKKRRFIFFRPSLKRRQAPTGDQDENGDIERGFGLTSPVDDGGDGDWWDRIWEPAPYPFVRLPENRATCMICLVEFEAPRRAVGDNKDDIAMAEMVSQGGDGGPHATDGAGRDVEEVMVESPPSTDARTVQLADSETNDAPEPLRLLSCGHVYHKDCVDSWLLQKSGRCPYCQARVKIPSRSRKNRSLRWRRW